jgi:hypothetical protein
MAEELVLTDPIVQPEVVTSKFRVTSISMNMEALPAADGVPALMVINLRDNNNAGRTVTYEGQVAKDYIKFVNTGNFSVNSLNKRLLQKLSTDGQLPGTVVGAPEP